MNKSEQDAEEYISGSAVRATFGTSPSTLRAWANAGKVTAVRLGDAGKRLYLWSDIQKAFHGCKSHGDGPTNGKGGSSLVSMARICNCRVSSAPQRDDLARQEDTFRREFPSNEIVKDIVSGINWKHLGSSPFWAGRCAEMTRKL